MQTRAIDEAIEESIFLRAEHFIEMTDAMRGSMIKQPDTNVLATLQTRRRQGTIENGPI